MVKLPIITTSAKVEDGNLKPILVVYPISQDLLTSLEVESLRIQTLLKYANYDYDLKEHHESSFSPSGSLPCLIVGGKVLAGRDLLSNVPNIDSSLTKVQQSVAFAHIEMTQSKLGMALELSMWYETSYFNEILAKSRGRYYPWPLNYLIPRVERSKKIEAMLSRKPVIQVQEIYQSAANALDALSLLLGEHLYFFGSRPTILDATVFAYVHCILTALSPTDSKLRKIVQSHKNLVDHAKRNWTNWFAPIDSVSASPRA